MKHHLLRSLFALIAAFGLSQANAQTAYMFSFTESRATVEGEKTFTLQFLNNNGTATALVEDAVVTFSPVVGDRTTAVKGTDYEYTPESVTVEAGKSQVEVSVKIIGSITEANNQLRLQAKVANTAGQTFSAGNNRYVTLTLSSEPAQEPSLSGTWQMNKLVTDKAAMDAAWNGMATFNEAYPAFNAEDKITFTQRTLEPALSSTLKNFFIGKAFIEDAGTYTLKGMTPKELKVLKVTGINRNFDANSQSESNVAYVGYRIIKDADTGEELLDVYLIDYVSTSFAPELAEYGMYEKDKVYPYYAWLSGLYINFTMKRVAEVPESIDKYAGAWKMKELVTDKAYMDGIWGGGATFDENFPAFNAQDWMVINSGSLEPHFASTLKNFFTGEAQVEFYKKYNVPAMKPISTDVFKVTGVNRNFDANSQSESNVAYIAMRLFTDGESGKELLDVYLIDYKSTSFALEWIPEMYTPDAENPFYAWMQGVYINFTMESTPTDIMSVESEQTAKAQGIYNLQGQKLQRLVRGINIVGGKKIVVK